MNVAVKAEPTPETFVEMVQRLYQEQFTGRTIIDWAQGHPRVVEIPGPPERITLDASRGRKR